MPDDPDYVPLLDVLQKVKQRRSVDDRAAQDFIRDAHCLGDLDLKIRRPNGSFEDLGRGVWQMDPWHGETWRQLFDRGIIQAEFRVRRSRRRVGGLEPCRIYGTRKSLNNFLGVSSAEGGQAPQAIAITKAAVKKTGTRSKRERAEFAIKALWPNGPPLRAEMLDGPLCRQVIDWLKADCKKRGLPFVPIGDSTILRAAGRKQ
jgi:hypothetical protein